MHKWYKKMPRLNKKVLQAGRLKPKGPGALIRSFTCSSGHEMVCYIKVLIVSPGPGHLLVQGLRKGLWSPGFPPSGCASVEDEAVRDGFLEYQEIREYSLHMNSRSFTCYLSEGNEEFCGGLWTIILQIQ